MSCSSSSTCTCDCCAGTSIQTPQPIANAPGQPAIAYRTGAWASFRESMLARLSSSDYPALANLRTRDSDDFTLALLDSSAVMLDILTFYQERLVNESYLRTAQQLRSLTELSRLIGYQPAPGVAAATYLAFTLKTTPGLPANPNNPAITIPAGSQVQSVPAQGQTPQTFETAAPIPAKSDWNALPIVTAIPWLPAVSDTSLYLAGTATQLQPGDIILILGDERRNNTASTAWDLRALTQVTPDPLKQRTLIVWKEGLGSPYAGPTQLNPTLYAMRQRASLFGFNAIDPNMLTLAIQQQLLGTGALINNSVSVEGITFNNFAWANHTTIANTIDLDTTYAKIAQNSWVALIAPAATAEPTRSIAGDISLYNAASVAQLPRTAFGLSAKITRITPDVPSTLPTYSIANTSVILQSEALAVLPQPIPNPLYGIVLDLDTLRPDLLNATGVALSGKAQKLTFNPGILNLPFAPSDLSTGSYLNQGDVITLAGSTNLPFDAVTTPPPPLPNWTKSTTPITLSILNPQSQPGTVTAPLSDFTLTPSAASDPTLTEYAQVLSVANLTAPYPHTQIVLTAPLNFCYDRAATTVNANVALATQGASVTEIMGSGSASTPNQAFALKQAPLTYVPANTPTGRQTTLNVRAAGVAWTEVPTLYDQPPTAQVFSTLNQPGGATTVRFGDSVEGATLPTGQSNLVATYRIGSGSSGNVAAATLTTLMDRPLGVSAVTNPAAATGGQDAATNADLQANAPQTVLTLGRAVSLADYQNFAANFSGISKAYAIWIPAGVGRGVFLTVAGNNGTAIPPSSPTFQYLTAALATYASPHIPVVIKSFLETLFLIEAYVAYDPAYDASAVQAQIRQTLLTRYSFAQRSFGQGVSSDEVATIIQAIPGVLGCNVPYLATKVTSNSGDILSLPGGFNATNWNAWQAGYVQTPSRGLDTPTRLAAWLPVPNLTILPDPAEILVLPPDPAFLYLGVMS